MCGPVFGGRALSGSNVFLSAGCFESTSKIVLRQGENSFSSCEHPSYPSHPSHPSHPQPTPSTWYANLTLHSTASREANLSQTASVSRLFWPIQISAAAESSRRRPFWRLKPFPAQTKFEYKSLPCNPIFQVYSPQNKLRRPSCLDYGRPAALWRTILV